MRCSVAFFFLWTFLVVTRVVAQPVAPDLPGLVTLATEPYLGRQAVADRLQAILPDLAVASSSSPALTAPDPFYWAISGRFGPPLDGTPAPGGVVACARYGLITREALAPRRSTDPEVFPVWQQALILSDDVPAWPDPAVARLACSITWDDGRRVAPLSEAEAEAALLTVFESVTTGPDPRERAGQARVFGAGGYRAAGQGVDETGTYRLDLFEVDQLATHHQILFRSFLMGGGV
ncbi:hypothetical protein DZD18_12880 [Rhodobacteraceae bacterium W635]|uniref:hypothetical protein n=1 Tax=Nioella halotolerans TaxID=2303578 RepID=UPI000E3EE3F8|nr:hypothetical protein DZD18_12880 [Rhodobacteraceae bacterium W635]